MYDENFYADLQKEEEAEAKAIALACDGPELEDDGKEERESYYLETYYYPSEGRVY